MRAKVIRTGEIVDVVKSTTYNPDKIYEDINSDRYWIEDELDFDDLNPTIDWEQRRFELVKAALQGTMANSNEDIIAMHEYQVAESCIEYADAVIEKLKER